MGAWQNDTLKWLRIIPKNCYESIHQPLVPETLEDRLYVMAIMVSNLWSMVYIYYSIAYLHMPCKVETIIVRSPS